MVINKWHFQLLIHQETKSYRSFPTYAEIPVTQGGNVLQHNLYNRINYLSPLSFSRESKEKKDVYIYKYIYIFFIFYISIVLISHSYSLEFCHMFQNFT